MNFSGLSRSSFAGWLLRQPLKLIPAAARMPILQGPLRGWWWIAGASNHGCWLGSYELNMSRFFARGVRSGDVVYDVGANVGYYTLLAAAAAGTSGRVIAFEPLPDNLNFLRQHIALNGLNQVEVIDAAVSDHAGEALFEIAADRSMGHVSGRGSLPVRLVTLDELVEGGKIPPPDCLKIDVEGAELQVLAGAKEMLARCGPDIYLATHGRDLHAGCCKILTNAGYRLQAVTGEPIADVDEIFATRR